MRFSSVFHLPAVPQHPAAPVRKAASTDQADRQQPPAQGAPAAPGQDLPEDLDARVRLIGEWQFDEGF
jgi:hypothetical protein